MYQAECSGNAPDDDKANETRRAHSSNQNGNDIYRRHESERY
jgi:hypothetical protein